MSTLLIVVLVLVVLIVLLAIGGIIGRRRQLAATRPRFEQDLLQVNRDLAAAHAEDRGWEPAALEDAARRAYTAERDGADAGELVLMQVLDRPGTDDDKAVFRVGSGGGERITLGRRDGEWVLESLE